MPTAWISVRLVLNACPRRPNEYFSCAFLSTVTQSCLVELSVLEVAIDCEDARTGCIPNLLGPEKARGT